jgi:hypothetical protein
MSKKEDNNNKNCNICKNSRDEFYAFDIEFQLNKILNKKGLIEQVVHSNQKSRQILKQ